MEDKPKHPKIVSLIILIAVSIGFLVFSLWPIIGVILMSPQERASIELEGIFIILFQTVMPLPCFLLALLVYKLLERFLKLYKLSTILVIVLPFLLIMPATLTFPVSYRLNRIRNDITIRRFDKVDKSLLREQVNKVQNTLGEPDYPGVNPYLYEYEYELKIDNQTDKTYVNLPIRISLGYDASDKPWKWDVLSLMSENRLNQTLKPGENIIHGKFPIVFFAGVYGKTPHSDPVELEFYVKIDGAGFKSFKLKSSLDWIKIYEEQQEFWSKNRRE